MAALCCFCHLGISGPLFRMSPLHFWGETGTTFPRMPFPVELWVRVNNEGGAQESEIWKVEEAVSPSRQSQLCKLETASSKSFESHLCHSQTCWGPLVDSRSVPGTTAWMFQETTEGGFPALFINGASLCIKDCMLRRQPVACFLHSSN